MAEPFLKEAVPTRPGINPLSAKRASERSRARELYRYYQPPSADATPTTEGVSPPPGPIASNDPSLIAYAQLTAIRLNCHRCMISLIDNTKQYIIAECTQTVSPLSPLDHGPGDELWLGGAEIIPRLGGLCENTVMLESHPRTARSKSQDITVLAPSTDFEMAFYNENDDITTLPMYEVEDLSKSDKFCAYPYVREPPALRYYCGVPLRTKKGYHIGSLCVVDGKPRKLDDESKRMLRWMANTVMQHLETMAEKNALRKVQRMQASLSRFVAGDWSDSTGITTPRFNKGKHAVVRTTKPSRRGSYSGETTESTGVSRRTTGPKRRHASIKNEPELEALQPVSPLYPKQQRPSIIDRNSSTSSAASVGSKFSASKLSQSSVSTADSAPPPLLPSIVVTPKAGPKPDGAAPLIPDATFKNTFTRASSLIRDALEVNGVIFMDAEVGHWTDMSGSERPAHSPSGHRTSDTILRSPKSTKATADRSSSVLGFATEHSMSPLEFVANHGNTLQPPEMELDPSSVGHLRESFLQNLLDKYPSGKIFSYDSDGNFSSSDEDGFDPVNGVTPPNSEDDLEQIKLKRAFIGQEMSGFMLGSKSCIFVPLFDYSGKAFAASFAWTSSNTRVFLKDELGYMTAFANSIMAEVSRLHTIIADRAKGNFISSISHELRSPLHGILASAEFLTDTKLDTFQSSLVETIESCGRTLLDTINHVLDFSKLNSLHNDVRTSGGANKRRRNQKAEVSKIHDGQGSLGPTRGPDGAVLNLVAETNIAEVTEEVVEGVFAGYEFRGVNTTALMENTNDGNIVPLQPETTPLSMGKVRSRSSSRDMQTLLMGKKEDLVVIVDIARRDNWSFVTQPGAFRRILMNVFGNALKYTSRGFVRVKLDAEEYDHDSESSSDDSDACCDGGRCLVTLTVSDSGRGISREFLKTKLFTPFSQENALASGAGLGMSIVRQIVEILGGTIDVKSELGVGTEVRVTFVLDRHVISNHDKSQPSPSLVNAPHMPSLPQTIDESDGNCTIISEVLSKSAGKRIAIVGFEPNDPSNEVACRSVEQLKSSFEHYARNWYNMVIVPTIPAASLIDYAGKADVILSNEHPGLLAQLHTKGAKPPTVVLCSNASRYDMYTTRAQADQGGVIDFASKPCGPHKLAKALLFCLGQTEISRRSSSSSGKSGSTVTASKGLTGRPPFGRGKSYASTTSTKGSSTAEDEVGSVGAIRFSPPVRSGSLSSEPIVYVPGIGTMAAVSGSSVVPINSSRRRSIPYFEDLHEIMHNGADEKSTTPTKERLAPSVSPSRISRNNSPRPSKSFIRAANPPGHGIPPSGLNEGPEFEGRPSLASPAIEKDNPLRPPSWAHWQSLGASANDAHGLISGAGRESATSSLSELLAKPFAAPDRPSVIVPVVKHAEIKKVVKADDNGMPSILIVEDNPINLMLLATFMVKKKYPFKQAENGLIALQAVEENPNGFDVIIMDIQMPVMSGIEATRHIRALEQERGPQHRSTIIALTGLAASDDQMEAFQSGVDYFVTKPISMKKIEAYLQKRQGW